jgi:hypothetical protein
MPRFTTLLVAILLSSSLAVAGPAGVSRLIEQLEEGTDFRVRVHAALELGKSGSNQARTPLESALDDDHAAVRAAAAAGLKVLGDRRSIAALTKRLSDSSPAVRSQVQNSIDALQKAKPNAQAADPEVLVQVGKFSKGTSGETRDASDAERASREKLRKLPGVVVVEEEQATTAAAPVVMVSGRVKRLESSRDGAAVTYSASVEFVVHRMPGQTIRGIISGSARASGAASADSATLAALRRSALEAAIESALRRAPTAFRAAAQ